MNSSISQGSMKRFDDDESPWGACYDCKILYSELAADFVIPNAYWEIINPSRHEGGGLLCFNCMHKRLESAGLKRVPFYIASDVFDSPRPSYDWMNQRLP